MSLYRIILVDDEEEVRKGIIRKIDWENLGFQVVGDAENGEDALEKIEQLEPDVVMTDIRMPYMDGLTLCSRIRQKYPSIKILIFSGFDDFEYAQTAIKLNVTEYILKPVNVEELTEILNRVRDNLDEEIEQRRNVSLLRESYRSSLPILRELYLNDLVRGGADTSMLEQKLQEYEVDILGARKWLAVVIDVELEEAEHGWGAGPAVDGPDSQTPLRQEKELIPISVRKLFEDNLKDYCRFTIFNSTAGITMILAVDDSNSQTGLIDLLGDICKETKRILEVSVTIGIGHNCTVLEQIGRSYQSAVDALGYKAIVGTGKPIYINDVEPVSRGKLQLESKDESELVAAIKFGPRENIETVVQTLTGRMGDAKVHVRQQQVYMMGMINCMTRLMQQYDLNLGEMFGSEDNYMELITSVQRRDDFAAWLVQVACRMHEAMNQERDNTTKKVILDAKQYIQDHYQDPDLSVEMMCRQIHMSPAYFSTLFKKETGQTYIAYLTEVRLDHAVELLNTTEDKTYVIAQKVGYQEQNYFSYVFKKQFGVSPTKYRSASRG
ncbi:MAG: response regulator [Eubacteriales bacterium]|nr:response regulator [Eubacteriales bacterium]